MSVEARSIEQSEIELVSQIIAACLSVCLTEVPRFLGSGAVNKVYAACADGLDVAVRFCEEWRGLSHYETEKWCLQQAMAVGVPGPQVLATGMLGSTPYMVQTLVTGISGDTVSAEDQTRVWQELGKYAKLIHSIEATGFGEQLIDAEQGFCSNPHSPTWIDFVDYNLSSLTPTDQLLSLGVYTDSQQPRIKSIFEALKVQRFKFGLCHGDLDPRNTILGAEGQLTLLDWGCASVNIVPHHDLIAILRFHDPQDKNVLAFLDGYGVSVGGFKSLMPALTSLRLLQAFDLVRWAIDKRTEEIPTYVSGAQTALASALKTDYP